MARGWTEITDDNAYAAALTLAKGEYQRNFLAGFENLSGEAS